MLRTSPISIRVIFKTYHLLKQMIDSIERIRNEIDTCHHLQSRYQYLGHKLFGRRCDIGMVQFGDPSSFGIIFKTDCRKFGSS